MHADIHHARAYLSNAWLFIAKEPLDLLDTFGDGAMNSLNGVYGIYWLLLFPAT